MRLDFSTFGVAVHGGRELCRQLLLRGRCGLLKLFEQVQFVLTAGQRVKPAGIATSRHCSVSECQMLTSARRPGAVIVALTLGLAGCAFDKPGINESPSTERTAKVVNGELYCSPGCTIGSGEASMAALPAWCSKHIVDPRSGELRCIQINLARISEGQGSFAPVFVVADPKNDTDLWRVNCRPGCELPVETFGCHKPAGIAPRLEWCALVNNKCNTGQSQIRVGPIRTTPRPGDDPTPYCTAILASRP